MYSFLNLHLRFFSTYSSVCTFFVFITILYSTRKPQGQRTCCYGGLASGGNDSDLRADVSGLNLERKTDFPEASVNVHSNFQTSAGLVALPVPRLRSTKSLPLNYLL